MSWILRQLPPPVFVDLVWERHRSPLVAALTVLRFLGFIYVSFVLSGLVNASKYCSDCDDASMSARTEIVFMLLQATSVLTAALASCTANSGYWVPFAVITGIAYLGVMGSQEFTHCAHLIATRTGDVDAIAVVVTGTIDLAFAVLSVIALSMWAYAEWGATRAAGRVYLARGGEPVGAAPAAAPQSAVDKVIYGIRVAPLRHHIAATLAFTFCLTATIALAILGQQQADAVVTQWWSPFVTQFNEFVDLYKALPAPEPGPYAELVAFIPPFINGIADVINGAGRLITVTIIEALQSAVVGASIACVVAIVSMTWSYVVIGFDHSALEAFFANHPRGSAAPQLDPAVVATASTEARAAPTGGFATALLKSDGMKHADDKAGGSGVTREPGAPSASGGCCRRPILFLDELTGTPDVSSDAFTYFNAFTYTSLYTIK